MNRIVNVYFVCEEIIQSEEKSTFTGHRQYGWTQENTLERVVLPSPAMSSV